MEVILVHPGISCLVVIVRALSLTFWLQKPNQLQQLWVTTFSFPSLKTASPQSIGKHQLNKQPSCEQSRWHSVSTADDRNQATSITSFCSKSLLLSKSITTVQQQAESKYYGHILLVRRWRNPQVLQVFHACTCGIKALLGLIQKKQKLSTMYKLQFSLLLGLRTA